MADEQHRQAMERAREHRRRAEEHVAEHRRSGSDIALARAKEEMAAAEAWERTAGTPERGTPQKKGSSQHAKPGKPAQTKGSFERDGEAAPFTARRTWYMEGSVSGDKLQQFQEAVQGGSLMGQLINYAARSTLDKNHRAFEGAKLLGKTIAAPVKGVEAMGRTTGNPGRAILERAAEHKAQTEQATQRPGKGTTLKQVQEKEGRAEDAPSRKTRNPKTKAPRATSRERER